jgi:sortase A
VFWALVGIKAQTVPSAPADAGRASVQATTAPEPPAQDATEPPPAKAAPTRPDKGKKVGTLSIPRLDQSFPIVEGTGARELKRGVGHFAQSVMPGEADNCVLSGHRDTVFTELGRLKIGDKLIVRTPDGEFTYKITRKRIVHKDDKTVIVPTDHAVLTVTTCYPFEYVGSAPDRYILVADLSQAK